MGLRYAIAVLGAMILASATAFLSVAVKPEMVGAAPTSVYPSPFALLVCPLVCVPLRYSSARAAMSSRQKSGMSGTTRPQTR
jgi:hypothetical protein